MKQELLTATGGLDMRDEIRYRVLYIDASSPNFVVGGRDGSDISGEARAPEIVERLETELGEGAFDANRILEWLGAQHSADAGDSAVLPLSDRLQLEIIVKSSE